MFGLLTKKTREETLLQGCKRHDEHSRKAVYDEYSRYMKGVCIRYTCDADVAEDIMHEGFVKVFLNVGKVEWRGQGSFKGWMIRVMVNASIDYLKHQKRLHEVPMEHASMVAVSDDDLDDEGEFSFETVKASGIGCEQLMDMLNSLPEANRVVFNLYAVEDMKHKTIAELLGITEEASRARLKRARMQLRDQLEQKMKLKRKVAHV